MKAFSGMIPALILMGMLSLGAISACVMSVWAWSNGGYSADPSNPDYGTHDWIAQHALDWLPTEEKKYILENLADYLYGTELPDNRGAPDGIGDALTKHHIYYNSAEVMTDDAAAARAATEYNNTLNFLITKDFAKAAKNAGIMSHYIVDMAVFGHVMGSSTDWGNETHHEDYENYVKPQTSSYNASFNSNLSFDGSLTTVFAYDAAKSLAYDTTFDIDGDLTCVWMDQNYNWSSPDFKNRAGESLNLAVNSLTDVLHTLYLDASLMSAEAYISVPYHSQIKNYYCGPAALEMVFDFYGPDIPQSEIADVARTAPDGTYTSDMMRASHFSNMSTSVGKEMLANITGYTNRNLGYGAFQHNGMTIDELKLLIAAGYPIIVLTTWHFRVAVGYDSTHITFQDSAYGAMYNMTYQAFDTDWDYSSHWAILVTPWIVEVFAPGIVSQGNVFNVTARISYPMSAPFTTGQYAASMVNATITLPVGLAPITGQTAKKTAGTGNLAAGSSANVTWLVRADDLGAFNISVEAEGKVAGSVPGLPSSPEPYNYADRIGGIGESEVTITGLDLIPPNTSDDYDGAWHSTDFTVTLSATDFGEGVAETYYRINGGPVRNIRLNGHPLTSTESANNTLKYWSIDNAGNEEPHKCLIGIKLDKSAPSGSIVINNYADFTPSASVTLTLTASDAISAVHRVRFSNDNVWDTEPWESLSTTKAWTLPLGDGTKTVYYQIKDNAGLISTSSDTIILDTTPPAGTVTINSNASYATSSTATLTLSAEDITSGVSQMRFSRDNSAWASWETYRTSKEWTIEETNGIAIAYVQFKDNADLTSPPGFDTIILDTTAPAISIASPSPGYETKSSTLAVTWSGSDETSGIDHYEIRLDDGSWINVGTDATRTFSQLGDGTHTIDIKAIDKAGNTKQDTVDFTINTSPLLGPGYMEEAVITAIVMVAALTIALYLVKMRKRR